MVTEKAFVNTVVPTPFDALTAMEYRPKEFPGAIEIMPDELLMEMALLIGDEVMEQLMGLVPLMEGASEFFDSVCNNDKLLVVYNKLLGASAVLVTSMVNALLKTTVPTAFVAVTEMVQVPMAKELVVVITPEEGSMLISPGAAGEELKEQLIDVDPWLNDGRPEDPVVPATMPMELF